MAWLWLWSVMRPNQRPNQLRIIGGQWRGRVVPFLPRSELRPSADRVRETLFNWLMFELKDARCLDLFAGSGILGLEALSRGAAWVQSVERDLAVGQQLRKVAQTLNTGDRWQIEVREALDFLASRVSRTPLADPAQTFDLIFLDPPYRSDLLNQIIAFLEQHSDLLTPQGLIYWETDAKHTLTLSDDSPFQIRKQKRAGGLRYGLLEKIEKKDKEREKI